MTGALLAALSAALAVWTWGSPVARLRSRDDPSDGAGSEPRIPQRVGLALATGASALLLTAGLGWWGVPAAAAVAVASYLVLGQLVSGEATKRNTELVAALPQVCDLLAVCLEAGLPLRRAVAVIGEVVEGPMRGVLAQLAARVNLGADEADAWAEVAAQEPTLASLCREVARTLGSGMGLARTMRALGADARREALAAKEVRAKRVGVRSVLPLMVCFLPAFLLLGVVPIIGGVASHLFR